MRRIELPEDYDQPARMTVGQTLLRVALGTLLIIHAMQRLKTLEPFQDELAMRFALLEPAIVAQVVLGLQFAGGVGLIVGWFTRLSALALLASVGLWVTLEVLRQDSLGAARLDAFELPAVLAASGLFFLLAGPGPASFHEWLRARARRKAIQNDETWQRHPYVASPQSRYEQSYERSYEETYRRPRDYDREHDREYDPRDDYEPEDSGQAYDERRAYDERDRDRDRYDDRGDDEPRNRYAGSRRR